MRFELLPSVRKFVLTHLYRLVKVAVRKIARAATCPYEAEQRFVNNFIVKRQNCYISEAKKLVVLNSYFFLCFSHSRGNWSKICPFFQVPQI